MSQLLQPLYLPPLLPLKFPKLQVVTRALYISVLFFSFFLFLPTFPLPPQPEVAWVKALKWGCRFFLPLMCSWHGLLAFIFHHGLKILSGSGVLSIFYPESQCHLWEVSSMYESLCFTGLNRTRFWEMKECMEFVHWDAKSRVSGTVYQCGPHCVYIFECWR